MLQELKTSKPLYIVDASTTGWFAIGLTDPLPSTLPAGAAEYRAQIHQLRRWVSSNYEPCESFGELTLYRLRTIPPDGLATSTPHDSHIPQPGAS